MVGMLIVLAGLVAAPEAPGVPPSVGLVREFSAEAYADPEALFWPAYFWLWNAPLDEDTLRAQLRDMAAHGARSVCMLPMPRGFRPDSTNNTMEPDYLTPEYFQRVRVAVEEAANLGMHWWLYDEGGWPSGLALGKVVEGHPELTRRRIVREAVPPDGPFTVPEDGLMLVVEGPEARMYSPGEVWNPAENTTPAWLYRITAEGASDLLNPDAVQRFVHLTHDAYAEVLAPYFGTTIRFTFTDEPGAAMPRMPDHLPWTPGLEDDWKERTGAPFQNALPKLFAPQRKDSSPEETRARIALYDLLSGRFAEVYFGGLERWGRSHGLASGGHLGGEDETLGAVKYSFGHVLRPLRRMDVPGVDLIWRQLVPEGGPQSNFPVLAPTAAHQNGTRFAFSESFCVYGNGLTPAQMKWLVDYQCVRGINLMVLGCYPLSTRDHHMTGERPHFGGMNPLWDHLPGFHAYTARLGYALSVGTPAIRTALYYPVRDLWAWGAEATEAVDTYEALQAGLAALPCAYDLIDDDTLASASLEDECLTVGPMRYDTIVCGDVRWMAPESHERLEAFARAGGQVLSIAHAPATDGATGSEGGPIVHGTIEEILKHVTPSVRLSPETDTLRVHARALPGQEIVMLFNEGNAPYSGAMNTAFTHACVLGLQQGSMTAAPVETGRLAVALAPGESVVYLLSDTAIPETVPSGQPSDTLTVELDALEVSRIRQWIAGEHDFEQRDSLAAPPAKWKPWKDWLGEDFSGEVDYRATIDLPKDWERRRLRLETGPIDYAASVYLDGKPMGQILWHPWRLDLPPIAPGKHELVVRVANTLANELTSERVVRDWAGKSGPGWPSPYHERALVFERESRGGGMRGPIRITAMKQDADVTASVQ